MDSEDKEVYHCRVCNEELEDTGKFDYEEGNDLYAVYKCNTCNKEYTFLLG